MDSNLNNHIWLLETILNIAILGKMIYSLSLEYEYNLLFSFLLSIKAGLMPILFTAESPVPR